MARVWASNHDGTPVYQTVRKIKKCKKSLKKWSRSHFGNGKKEIKTTKDLLWKVEEDVLNGGNPQEVVQLKAELNLLLDREEQIGRAHV